MRAEALKTHLGIDRTALLVVDVQNDFCHPNGALARAGKDVSHIQRMIPRLLDFIQEARRAGLPIIYLKTENDSWTRHRALVSQQLASRRETPCPAGSWGAEFYRVAPARDERVIVKRRYSGFVNTDLDLILRARGIRTLIMTGVASNVCVESTARDGFMRGYSIVFLSDCTAATDPDEHRAALRNIEQYFGIVVSSETIIRLWRSEKTGASCGEEVEPER